MKAEREVLHTEEINAKISFVNEVAQIDNEELKRNMANLLENPDKYYEEKKVEKEIVHKLFERVGERIESDDTLELIPVFKRKIETKLDPLNWLFKWIYLEYIPGRHQYISSITKTEHKRRYECHMNGRKVNSDSSLAVLNIFKRLLESSQPKEPVLVPMSMILEASNEDQDDALNDDDDDEWRVRSEVESEEELRLALREEVWEIKERVEEKGWVLPDTLYHYRHLWMLNLPYVKFGKYKTEEVIREAKLFHMVERNRYNENREETMTRLLQKLKTPKKRLKDASSMMPIETLPSLPSIGVFDAYKKRQEEAAAAAIIAMGAPKDDDDDDDDDDDGDDGDDDEENLPTLPSIGSLGSAFKQTSPKGRFANVSEKDDDAEEKKKRMKAAKDLEKDRARHHKEIAFAKQLLGRDDDEADRLTRQSALLLRARAALDGTLPRIRNTKP